MNTINAFQKLFQTNRMALGLLILRVTLGAYLLQWAWLNVFYSQEANKIYARWYDLSLSNELATIFGYVLFVLGSAVIFGLGRRITYGLSAIIMSIMILGLLPHLINPFGIHKPPYYMNHALIAQVPMLAGYITIFFLQRLDNFSLDQWFTNQSYIRSQPSSLTSQEELKISLVLLLTRVMCALFFLFWGSEKFVKTDFSVGILERWYGISSHQHLTAYLVGVLEIALAICIALGLFRRFVYGLAVIIKAKTIWAISALIFFPFASQTGGRLSTVGASPSVFAILLFLYLVRHWDKLSIDVRRSTQHYI